MSYLARAERRQSIIDAAVRVLIREGFAGLTTRSVARELGSSPGQIHHHFESTGELAIEAWRSYTDAEIAAFHTATDALGPRERLSDFFGNFTDGTSESELRLWANAWAHAQSTPDFAPAYLESYQELVGVLTELFRDGEAAALITLRSTPGSAAARILLLAIGLSGMAAIDPEGFSERHRTRIIGDALSAELGA
ncbi:TetR family transcriptional regulator C-terminal domain-containing protein [Leucobacter sp. M11]|uniref:TetR family transcriptional regulator C-terminal domain-containing protein n=1 Tax=Leucobacter sp. M11 TaxID=2993565 RepID=UPI002D7F0B00|nr:TetR family transcriptional regulator C-terminal domain-containing protein [Leucobacter sp. M11]MEB4613195.1 TetR family transcriptional regulator C-terminal domain-containing protein [Leucobacter sp. M11]